MPLLRPISPYGLYVLLLLLIAPEVRAGVDICSDPGDHSFAALEFVNHERSFLNDRAGSTNQENQDLDLLVASRSKRFRYGFGHRYMIFDFDDIEPQTNAHLHTSFFPLHWKPAGSRNFRVSAALALSASSNVMGHPRQYESDTLQFLFSLASARRLSNEVGITYGICGDHRFGEYAVYPTAAIHWQPHPDWTFELGFPASQVRYQVASEVTTGLRIAPDGNEWRVMNRNFDAASRFVYESFALEWTTGWRVHPRLTVNVSLGRQLRNRYEMTMESGQRVQLSSDPANRLGIGLRWRF